MKLTGNLKTQVDNAPTKEEKREAIKQAGMLLTDDELDQVAGGQFSTRLTPAICSFNPACPHKFDDYCNNECPHNQN